MDTDAISNENEQNLSVETLESNANDVSPPTPEKTREIAAATFASLDASIRSSLNAEYRAFKEAEKRLDAANAERDRTWNALPESVKKALAKATYENPKGSSSEFLYLKPEELPIQTFDDAVRARLRQLQARKLFRSDRAVCCKILVDRFLLTCSGSSTFDAPFPAEEFQPKATILKDLYFCDSTSDAMKIAEARWKVSRPCVVENRLRKYVTQETKTEKRKRMRAIKRQMFREFSSSPEWKKSSTSFFTILNALTASAFGVVLLWLAILKWNLVYLLRYESIFPYKSDAYRFLYFMTPLVWLALALLYRNVVVFRLKFRSLFKTFEKEEADAANALK